MIERHVLTLAVGHLGEDRAPRGGGSRRRSRRAPAHEWRWRDGLEECRWCATRRTWIGAAMGCGNAHAKNDVNQKAVANALRILSGRNEEARAACDSTGLGNRNSLEEHR